jgi:putative endonuclease
MEKGGCIYIVTNSHHTTLYVCVTADIYSRIVEHREKVFPNSFTSP